MAVMKYWLGGICQFGCGGIIPWICNGDDRQNEGVEMTLNCAGGVLGF